MVRLVQDHQLQPRTTFTHTHRDRETGRQRLRGQLRQNSVGHGPTSRLPDTKFRVFSNIGTRRQAPFPICLFYKRSDLKSCLVPAKALIWSLTTSMPLSSEALSSSVRAWYRDPNICLCTLKDEGRKGEDEDSVTTRHDRQTRTDVWFMCLM